MAKVPPLGHHKEPGHCVGFFVFGALLARPPPSSSQKSAMPASRCAPYSMPLSSVPCAGDGGAISSGCAMNPKVRELLGEPSTWRGIALLITAAGIQLSPDQVAAITSTGLAVTGFIGAFCRDKGGQ